MTSFARSCYGRPSHNRNPLSTYPFCPILCFLKNPGIRQNMYGVPNHEFTYISGGSMANSKSPDNIYFMPDGLDWFWLDCGTSLFSKKSRQVTFQGWCLYSFCFLFSMIDKRLWHEVLHELFIDVVEMLVVSFFTLSNPVDRKCFSWILSRNHPIFTIPAGFLCSHHKGNCWDFKPKDLRFIPTEKMLLIAFYVIEHFPILCLKLMAILLVDK